MRVFWVVRGAGFYKIPFRPEQCRCNKCEEHLFDVWEMMAFGGVRVDR